MRNPWNVQSIYELQYFNCPSCVFKNSSKQEFIDHAYEIHPESVNLFRKISDNSLNDVSCPWIETSITKIEIDETDSQELNLEPLQNELISEIKIEEPDVFFDELNQKSINNETEIHFATEEKDNFGMSK